MMKETASRLGEIPSRGEMMRMAKERKMANWNPKLFLGDEKVDYETDARRKVDPNAFKESVAATRDSRNRAKGMKAALTKTQWQLGQESSSMADAVPTSRLPDPTGPGFSSYRGKLDPAMGRRIKHSAQAKECMRDPGVKIDYESVAKAG
eukprot:CAMPEP_0182485690 /NCGR_PEP_ID=MMETSP1319-20130603/45707_1 /TAXON_ID=172717 /ORGANISM="Bolidomonas pacifica, Strain RCC208" /LENGTH=149 /DNA_ID=CAMNT_0024687701 /DNA_START=38 /DNA_END=484 /DNA_ORIENTATION=-